MQLQFFISWSYFQRALACKTNSIAICSSILAVIITAFERLHYLAQWAATGKLRRPTTTYKWNLPPGPCLFYLQTDRWGNGSCGIVNCITVVHSRIVGCGWEYGRARHIVLFHTIPLYHITNHSDISISVGRSVMHTCGQRCSVAAASRSRFLCRNNSNWCEIHTITFRARALNIV